MSATMGKLRVVYFCLGILFLGLAIFGVVLPAVPSTPFLILAAWAFARSSKRLHSWLMTHPRLGPPIRRWETHRVIPLPAKTLAIAAMAVSMATALWMEVPPVLLVLMGAVIAVGAVFILRCPSRVGE